MTSAIVKWFNAKKGYGFLVVEGIDQDVFVHYSVIEGEGFRTLSQGERVQVDVGDDGKGPRARKVYHTEGSANSVSSVDSLPSP